MIQKLAFFRSPVVILASLILPAAVAASCSSKATGTGATQGSGGNSGTLSTSSGMGGTIFGDAGVGVGGGDGSICNTTCSPDHQAVVDCNGKVLTQCMAGQGCDLTTQGCADPCTAAVHNQSSVGCEYYATRMEMDFGDQCFAAFVANTWSTPAHIKVEFYPGTPLSVANFARIPSGSGATIKYAPYDPAAGLAPGEVAILFLGGVAGSGVPCPAGVTAAIPQGSLVQGTGMGHSFHIQTDVPVVSYQINPYGGGAAAITGASLLLPTSAWDTNYVGVTAAPFDIDKPSINVVAYQDGTQVTLLPIAAIEGGNGLPAGPANKPYMFMLNKGEQAQFSQQADLTGSILQSTKPVGLMAGNACMREPSMTPFCDHGEQMIPPVKALGNEYVGVMFRPRVMGDKAIWRLVGALDGTQLTYSSPVGGPATIKAGQVVEFINDQPFVVTSQDKDHPFYLFTLMSGAEWSQLSDTTGYGDPDFVLSVPARQYLNDYVFFADPTYPETNLVVVRSKNKMGTFDDVTLDCVSGPLPGWAPVGEYEWTRVDLTRHDFQDQGNCSTGRHEIKSKGLFGLWVWGWGTPETTTFTKYVSYGYPGGMNVQPLSTIVIPPVAK